MSGFIGWLGSFLKLMITLWMISLGPYFSCGAFTASMLPKIWADAGRPPCCRALRGRRTQPFGKNLLKARSSVLRLLQLCCGWAVVVSYVGYIILVYVGNMMDRTNVHLPLYHWSVHFFDSLFFLSIRTHKYRQTDHIQLKRYMFAAAFFEHHLPNPFLQIWFVYAIRCCTNNLRKWIYCSHLNCRGVLDCQTRTNQGFIFLFGVHD